jgi:hypothetical protein
LGTQQNGCQLEKWSNFMVLGYLGTKTHREMVSSPKPLSLVSRIFWAIKKFTASWKSGQILWF